MFILFIRIDLEQLLLLLIPCEYLCVPRLEPKEQQIPIHLHVCQLPVYHDRLVDVTLPVLEPPDLHR